FNVAREHPRRILKSEFGARCCDSQNSKGCYDRDYRDRNDHLQDREPVFAGSYCSFWSVHLPSTSEGALLSIWTNCVPGPNPFSNSHSHCQTVENGPVFEGRRRLVQLEIPFLLR